MKIRLIDFGVTKERCPFRPHENDAGADVFMPFDCRIKPGEIIKIPLGYGIEIPDGFAGYVFPDLSANFRRLTQVTEEKSMQSSVMSVIPSIS